MEPRHDHGKKQVIYAYIEICCIHNYLLIKKTQDLDSIIPFTAQFGSSSTNESNSSFMRNFSSNFDDKILK